MNRKFFLATAISAILTASFAAAPDYRPAFDKTSYKGTVWTQVNPWWLPSKQRVDDSGGPNYARMKHPKEKQWEAPWADSYRYGKVNWQVELHVSAPGFANGMKHMMQQAKSSGLDVKFSVFLVYYGRKDLNKEIEKTMRSSICLKRNSKTTHPFSGSAARRSFPSIPLAISRRRNGANSFRQSRRNAESSSGCSTPAAIRRRTPTSSKARNGSGVICPISTASVSMATTLKQVRRNITGGLLKSCTGNIRTRFSN